MLFTPTERKITNYMTSEIVLFFFSATENERFRRKKRHYISQGKKPRYLNGAAHTANSVSQKKEKDPLLLATVDRHQESGSI